MWFQASTRFSFLSPFFFSAICYICSFPLSKTKHPYQCVCVCFFLTPFPFSVVFLLHIARIKLLFFSFSKKPQNKNSFYAHRLIHVGPTISLSFFFFQGNTKEGDAQKPANHVCKSSELLLSSSLLVSFGNVRTNVFFFVSLLTTTAANKKKEKKTWVFRPCDVPGFFFLLTSYWFIYLLFFIL